MDSNGGVPCYVQAQNLEADPAAQLLLEGTKKSRLLNEPSWLSRLLLLLFFPFLWCCDHTYCFSLCRCVGGVVPLCGVRCSLFSIL